jgi:uncharacterized membrane protein YheB (UPF0754 family)
MVKRIIRPKIPIQQLFYEELEDEEQKNESTISKCALTRDDWECLGNIKYVLEPFKEIQKICEAQNYVILSLVPILIKIICQELMALDDEMQREHALTPFAKGSNKEGLVDLVSRMIVDFEHHWGTEEPGTFLCENEERTKGQGRKGRKKTQLVAFILDPRTKDLCNPIPDEDMEEIRQYTFEDILKYAEKKESVKRKRNTNCPPEASSTQESTEVYYRSI